MHCAYRDVLCVIVDEKLNAKIADLELSGDGKTCGGYVEEEVQGQGGSRGDSSASSFKRSVRRERLLANGQLLVWLAPEIIRGHDYFQVSDIYSFGLVLWEIVSGNIPFEQNALTTNILQDRSQQSQSRRTDTSASNSLTINEDVTQPLPNVQGSGSGNRSSGGSKSSGGQSFKRQNSWFGYEDVDMDADEPLLSDEAKHEDLSCRVVRGERPVIMSHYGDENYRNIIQACWQDDFTARPTSAMLVDRLQKCWLNTVHNHIYATEHLINMDVVYSERSARMKQTTPSKRQANAFGSNPMNGPERLIAAVPSSSLMAAVSAMKRESRWLTLEESGQACVVLTPAEPQLIVWATKQWTNLTGYFINELIASELSCLYGPHTNRAAIATAFREICHDVHPSAAHALGGSSLPGSGRFGPFNTTVNSDGTHIICTLYKRDGEAMTCSLHMIPIYDAATVPSGRELQPVTSRGVVAESSIPRAGQHRESEEASKPMPIPSASTEAPTPMDKDDSSSTSPPLRSISNSLSKFAFRSASQKDSKGEPAVAPPRKKTVAYIVVHFSHLKYVSPDKRMMNAAPNASYSSASFL